MADEQHGQVQVAPQLQEQVDDLRLVRHVLLATRQTRLARKWRMVREPQTCGHARHIRDAKNALLHQIRACPAAAQYYIPPVGFRSHAQRKASQTVAFRVLLYIKNSFSDIASFHPTGAAPCKVRPIHHRGICTSKPVGTSMPCCTPRQRRSRPQSLQPPPPRTYNLLYRIVAAHFEIWLELASAGQFDGQGDHHTPPSYVKKAFRKSLECGLCAHGFAQARCDDCGHDYLVVFSCKGRAVCLSCNTWRTAEAAAHPSDHVFPRLPVRQGVLSMPKRLRYARSPCVHRSSSDTT